MEDLLIIYHKALMSLAVLCLAVMIQSFMHPFFAFTKKGGQTPGSVVGGPEDFSWRVIRTYLNSTENLPVFIGILLLAIWSGVSPYWVNLLACIHVVARLLFWAVYYSKLGIKTPGLRTLCFVAGFIANVVLAVMVIVALVH